MTTVREKIKKNPEITFAKKEDVAVSPDLLAKMNVIIPPIYYWQDVVSGKSELMTMAFVMFGRNFGRSYPIEDDNAVKIDMLRKKLFWVVRESLDVLLHHGEKVLDIFGNIDPKKVNDEEALRFKYDTRWMMKVAAFNKLVRIAPITKEKAVELGLLDKPKVAF
mgnify:CR=1 FL=1